MVSPHPAASRHLRGAGSAAPKASPASWLATQKHALSRAAVTALAGCPCPCPCPCHGTWGPGNAKQQPRVAPKTSRWPRRSECPEGEGKRPPGAQRAGEIWGETRGPEVEGVRAGEVSVPSAASGGRSAHRPWWRRGTGGRRGPSRAAASWLARWCSPAEGGRDPGARWAKVLRPPSSSGPGGLPGTCCVGLPGPRGHVCQNGLMTSTNLEAGMGRRRRTLSGPRSIRGTLGCGNDFPGAQGCSSAAAPQFVPSFSKSQEKNNNVAN